EFVANNGWDIIIIFIRGIATDEIITDSKDLVDLKIQRTFQWLQAASTLAFQGAGNPGINHQSLTQRSDISIDGNFASLRHRNHFYADALRCRSGLFALFKRVGTEKLCHIEFQWRVHNILKPTLESVLHLSRRSQCPMYRRNAGFELYFLMSSNLI